MHFKVLCRNFCLLFLLNWCFLVLDWQLGRVTMKKHKDQYNLIVIHSYSRQFSRPIFLYNRHWESDILVFIPQNNKYKNY